MAEIPGKLNELQLEEFNKKSPDNEIARVRLIEMMNLLDRESYHTGDVVESFLTYDEFRSVMGNTWTIMQGQNIQSSDLGAELSLNSLPDLVTNLGMIVQSETGSDLGETLPGRNKDHAHNFTRGSNTATDYFYGSFTSSSLQGTNPTNAECVIDGTDIFPDAFAYFNGSTTSTRSRESIDGNPEADRCNSSFSGDVFKPKSYNVNYFIKVNKSRSWEDV